MTFRIGVNRTDYSINTKFEQSELNDINNMYHMNIIAEQKHLSQNVHENVNFETNVIHFHVSLFFQPYLFSGIYEIPTEVNRIIMSFLKKHIKFTLILKPSYNFPYFPNKWSFETSSNSSQILTKCLQYALERENNQFSYVSFNGRSNWIVTYTPEKMCLLLIMRLKKDLTSILEYL